MLLRTMIRKPGNDSFDKMEHLGMLPYVIGSHQKQVRSLIRNPVEYSRKCQEL